MLTGWNSSDPPRIKNILGGTYGGGGSQGSSQPLLTACPLSSQPSARATRILIKLFEHLCGNLACSLLAMHHGSSATPPVHPFRIDIRQIHFPEFVSRIHPYILLTARRVAFVTKTKLPQEKQIVEGCGPSWEHVSILGRGRSAEIALRCDKSFFSSVKQQIFHLTLSRFLSWEFMGHKTE